jgi:hypothetical protein
MIRFVVSFPPESRVSQQALDILAEHMREATSDRQWRDLILTMGGTIKDMRTSRTAKPVWVKNAQRRLR